MMNLNFNINNIKNDYGFVDSTVSGYIRPEKGQYGKMIKWACYRLWNGTKYVFGKSDWQIAKKDLKAFSIKELENTKPANLPSKYVPKDALKRTAKRGANLYLNAFMEKAIQSNVLTKVEHIAQEKFKKNVEALKSKSTRDPIIRQLASAFLGKETAKAYTKFLISAFDFADEVKKCLLKVALDSLKSNGLIPGQNGVLTEEELKNMFNKLSTKG